MELNGAVRTSARGTMPKSRLEYRMKKRWFEHTSHAQPLCDQGSADACPKALPGNDYLRRRYFLAYGHCISAFTFRRRGTTGGPFASQFHIASASVTTPSSVGAGPVESAKPLGAVISYSVSSKVTASPVVEDDIVHIEIG